MVPVVEALAVRRGDVRVSVDTVKPAVAEAAVAAGATLVNDISASLWPVAAGAGVGWVAMHMQGAPRDHAGDPRYDDVVAEVRAFLLDRAPRALAAGVRRGLGRPRHRLRQDRRPQPGPAAPPPRASWPRPGCPGARGDEPQGLPGAIAAPGAGPRARPGAAGLVATATWAMLARGVDGAGPRRRPCRGGGGPGWSGSDDVGGERCRWCGGCEWSRPQ